MYAGAGSCGECAAEQCARCTTHLDLGGVLIAATGGTPRPTRSPTPLGRTRPRYSFSSPGFGVAGDAGGGGAGGGGGEKGEDGDGGGGGGGASSAGYLTRAQL